MARLSALFGLLVGSTLIGLAVAQCPSGSSALPYSSFPCTSNIQCENQAPGYYCYNGFCCSDGRVTTNTVAYGGYCIRTSQCRDAALQCLNNVCTCPSGYSYNGYGCIKDCASNEVRVNGECLPARSIGMACDYTAQCVNYGSSQRLVCQNGICQYASSSPYYGDSFPTCRDPRAQVQTTNGVPLNCLNSPCHVGYFCEYNANYNGGSYICCGTDANGIYGEVRMYAGTSRPMECSAINSCPYVDTPHCVMSYRYGYKVCCSTTNC